MAIKKEKNDVVAEESSTSSWHLSSSQLIHTRTGAHSAQFSITMVTTIHWLGAGDTALTIHTALGLTPAH